MAKTRNDCYLTYNIGLMIGYEMNRFVKNSSMVWKYLREEDKNPFYCGMHVVCFRPSFDDNNKLVSYDSMEDYKPWLSTLVGNFFHG